MGRQQGPREGMPGGGRSCGMLQATRAQRHCRTASHISPATRAGGSMVRLTTTPSWVRRVWPSNRRHPSLAREATVAVAGPQTHAHGRLAPLSLRIAQAATCRMSDRGIHSSQTALAQVTMGSR